MNTDSFDFDIIKILKELYSNKIILVSIALILLIGNIIFYYYNLNKNFKAGVDVYPLTEFKYSDLWSLQQSFKYTGEGIFIAHDPKLHPDYRLNPDFMSSNEITLFKKYKDYAMINRKELMDRVMKNLKLDKSIALEIADYSQYQIAADLSNRFVTFTFYEPSLDRESYKKIIREFVEEVRKDINARLFREAQQNIYFIDEIIKKEEEILKFKVFDLVEFLYHKIRVYRRASIEAKSLGIEQPLSLYDDSIAGKTNQSQTVDKLLALEAAEGLPLIISGYLALNKQIELFEADIEEIKKYQVNGKINEIFLIFSDYVGPVDSGERAVTYRRHMLSLLQEKLKTSNIAKNQSPIVEVKFENMFFYSANNVLMIPVISIFIYFLLILFFVFRSFKN